MAKNKTKVFAAITAINTVEYKCNTGFPTEHLRTPRRFRVGFLPTDECHSNSLRVVIYKRAEARACSTPGRSSSSARQEGAGYVTCRAGFLPRVPAARELLDRGFGRLSVESGDSGL